MKWTATRLVLLALLVGAVTFWVHPARAYGVSSPSYSICATTWRRPKSMTARACRVIGWEVRAFITVDPNRYLREARMQRCPARPRCIYVPPNLTNSWGWGYWVSKAGVRHYFKVTR